MTGCTRYPTVAGTTLRAPDGQKEAACSREILLVAVANGPTYAHAIVKTNELLEAFPKA
jgi:hypothetical protein